MQIVGPYGVSTVASMQENAVLDLEDLYMMVERVRVGKRVNGGPGRRSMQRLFRLDIHPSSRTSQVSQPDFRYRQFAMPVGRRE